MEEFKPNSNRSKEVAKAGTPEKKVTKVVSGKLKKTNRLKDIFISEDASSVKSYILTEILVPMIKKTISESLRAGLDILFYGENGRTERNTNPSRLAYSTYYSGENDRRTYTAARPKTAYSYENILLPTRADAMEVLEQMDELIERYGIVSVADLYGLVDLPCGYTADKYGWKDLQTAEPIRVDDGYILRLPKALPIN